MELPRMVCNNIIVKISSLCFKMVPKLMLPKPAIQPLERQMSQLEVIEPMRRPYSNFSVQTLKARAMHRPPRKQQIQ